MLFFFIMKGSNGDGGVKSTGFSLVINYKVRQITIIFWKCLKKITEYFLKFNGN